MEALPYYKWYWQRFRASRTTQRMGYVARGLYRELLDEQWVKGGIPEDLEQLALVCDCPLEVMQAEWPKIVRCFSIKRRGLLMNGTLESMRTETDTKRTKRVLSGSKGGVRKAIGINAVVAGAKHLPEASKRVLANAGNCHIGEERREEESKEQKPFRAKGARATPKHSSDPRHVACKERIFAAYRHKNNGADPDWDGREGRALGMLLGANPALNEESINPLLAHWARSEVNHSDRPGIWIPKLSSFRIAPIDRFNKPKPMEAGSGQDQSKAGRRVDDNRRAIAEALAKRGVDGPWSANGANGAPLAEPGSSGFDGSVPERLRGNGPEILAPSSSRGH